jgi:hypothetical protein
MMREISRVLRPGGVCWFAGGHTLQLIEPHYRLPLLSLMPCRVASWIVRATRRGDGYAIRFLPPWRLRELFAPFADAQMVSVDVFRDPYRYALAHGILRHKIAQAVVRTGAPLIARMAPTHWWLLRKV